MKLNLKEIDIFVLFVSTYYGNGMYTGYRNTALKNIFILISDQYRYRKLNTCCHKISLKYFLYYEALVFNVKCFITKKMAIYNSPIFIT